MFGFVRFFVRLTFLLFLSILFVFSFKAHQSFDVQCAGSFVCCLLLTQTSLLSLSSFQTSNLFTHTQACMCTCALFTAVHDIYAYLTKWLLGDCLRWSTAHLPDCPSPLWTEPSNLEAGISASTYSGVPMLTTIWEARASGTQDCCSEKALFIFLNLDLLAICQTKILPLLQVVIFIFLLTDMFSYLNAMALNHGFCFPEPVPNSLSESSMYSLVLSSSS